MVEMIIGQIVKIVIAVLVIVVVIVGVWIGFRNYIFPYFEGLGPSNVSSGLVLLYLFKGVEGWINE